MTNKYWTSFWTKQTEDEFPVKCWTTGQRYSKSDKDWTEFSICSLIEAENADDVVAMIKEYFPDFELRFCRMDNTLTHEKLAENERFK